MRGMGRIFKRAEIYWIAYCHRGKEYRESSHSENVSAARKLLKKRIGEIGRGRLIGPAEERVMFEDMAADLVHYYEINRKRSLKSLPYWLRHLRESFGGCCAVDITPNRVRAYVAARLHEQATSATINRELGALKRMFALAVRDNGRLSTAPYIRLLEENNARQGFVEPGDFARLRDELPSYLRDAVWLLYLSGWRVGEMRTLEWRDVDLEQHGDSIDGGAIRLRAEHSKNGHGRTLKLKGELLNIIARAAAARRLDCPFIFHRDAEPIGDFRKAWFHACSAAGLNGLLVHDLRRSGVRNMIRAGIPERVAMAISGHRTRSMFDRYNIVSEGDLDTAAEQITSYVDAHQRIAKTMRVPGARAA